MDDLEIGDGVDAVLDVHDVGIVEAGVELEEAAEEEEKRK